MVPADPGSITQSRSGWRVDSTRCFYRIGIVSSIQEAVGVHLRDTLRGEEARAWLRSQGLGDDDVEIIRR